MDELLIINDDPIAFQNAQSDLLSQEGFKLIGSPNDMNPGFCNSEELFTGLVQYLTEECPETLAILLDVRLNSSKSWPEAEALFKRMPGADEVGSFEYGLAFLQVILDSPRIKQCCVLINSQRMEDGFALIGEKISTEAKALGKRIYVDSTPLRTGSPTQGADAVTRCLKVLRNLWITHLGFEGRPEGLFEIAKAYGSAERLHGEEPWSHNWCGIVTPSNLNALLSERAGAPVKLSTQNLKALGQLDSNSKPFIVSKPVHMDISILRAVCEVLEIPLQIDENLPAVGFPGSPGLLYLFSLADLVQFMRDEEHPPKNLSLGIVDGSYELKITLHSKASGDDRLTGKPFGHLIRLFEKTRTGEFNGFCGYFHALLEGRTFAFSKGGSKGALLVAEHPLLETFRDGMKNDRIWSDFTAESASMRWPC